MSSIVTGSSHTLILQPNKIKSHNIIMCVYVCTLMKSTVVISKLKGPVLFVCYNKIFVIK